jgi:glutamine synthetase
LRSIPEITGALHAEFGLTPLVAAEIECYVLLTDESSTVMDQFWVPVEKAFRHEGLPILRIEKERGLHQYEIITQVMTPELLVATLASIRSIIEKYAARMGVQSSFAAKPFAHQPSSGMHIHLHLADDAGENVYHKTDEWTSDTLRFSLGGLLAAMAADMPIFFPNADDLARLDDIDHVPKIFGWGVNNRYCALRIPADPDFYNKRIEHRVACANANPTRVMEALLGAVLTGLREQMEPPAQEYGKTGGISVKQLALVTIG